MAFVTVESSKKTIADVQEIKAYLHYHGITYKTWDVPESLSALTKKDLLSSEEKTQVLTTYKPQLDDLAATGGYIQNDVISLCPATPQVEELLRKFDHDHYHTEDEVRFILSGRGIFGFEGKGREKFSIEVAGGDFITIPSHHWHWFTLGESRDIKAVRLFQDLSGWTPYYRQHSDEPAPTHLRTSAVA